MGIIPSPRWKKKHNTPHCPVPKDVISSHTTSWFLGMFNVRLKGLHIPVFEKMKPLYSYQLFHVISCSTGYTCIQGARVVIDTPENEPIESNRYVGIWGWVEISERKVLISTLGFTHHTAAASSPLGASVTKIWGRTSDVQDMCLPPSTKPPPISQITKLGIVVRIRKYEVFEGEACP